MSGSTLIFLEAALVIGVVFGFGAWQLYTLRRDRRREQREPAAPPDDDARR